jgi:hypothetical protein
MIMSMNVSEMSTTQTSFSASSHGGGHSHGAHSGQSAPMFPPDGGGGQSGMGPQAMNQMMQDLMKLCQDLMKAAAGGGGMGGGPGGMMG